jgi:hypothetical protein
MPNRSVNIAVVIETRASGVNIGLLLTSCFELRPFGKLRAGYSGFFRHSSFDIRHFNASIRVIRGHLFFCFENVRDGLPSCRIE